MRQCIFASCKCRPDDRIGNVALVHRFPREEHIQKQWVQWIRENCDMPTFEATPKAVLCYRHFDRRCYHRSNGLLKPFSYPSYTPKDLDNVHQFGPSTQLLPLNSAPRTNLIIKVDPSLVKQSSSGRSDQGKKFVLLVTDKGMPVCQSPNSREPFLNSADAGDNMINFQDIPPLRFYGTERPSTTSDAMPLNQDKAPSVIRSNSTSAQSQPRIGLTHRYSATNMSIKKSEVLVSQNCILRPCATEQPSISQEETRFSNLRKEQPPRTVKLIQTVLNSSRCRLREYRRRLQLERKRINRLEELIEEMKKEQLISIDIAERIEAVLYDD